MKKSIFWISSYPKSGNTLIRAIVSSLFFTNDGLFSLDKLQHINQFDITALVQKNKNLFGNDFDKLSDTNIFYKYLLKLQSRESLGLNQDFMFLKTHSGLFKISGNPFTTQDNTRGIIYIVRDPRDISISWSKHLGVSIDECINNITNELLSSPWVEPSNKKIFLDKSYRPKSFLSSWDRHVTSWTSLDWDTPIIVIKYEDLIINKEKVIINLINFFSKNYNFKFKDIDKKIKNIIISTNFNKLSKEEDEKGFSEATSHNKFFSTGKKDQWKNKLTKAQIVKIEKKLKDVMIKFKYKLSTSF